MTGRRERRLRPDHAWFPKTLFFSLFFLLFYLFLFFFPPFPRVIIEMRAGWSGGQGSNTNDHESRESKHTDNNAGSCNRESNKTQCASFKNCVRFGGGGGEEQQQQQQLYALQCTDRTHTHTHTVVYSILPFYFGLFLPPWGKNDSLVVLWWFFVVSFCFVLLFFYLIVLLFLSLWFVLAAQRSTITTTTGNHHH